jgi:hypothetical protein
LIVHPENNNIITNIIDLYIFALICISTSILFNRMVFFLNLNEGNFHLHIVDKVLENSSLFLLFLSSYQYLPNNQNILLLVVLTHIQKTSTRTLQKLKLFCSFVLYSYLLKTSLSCRFTFTNVVHFGSDFNVSAPA